MIPIRRSSAEAVQILISHALGDAGSPYIIGLITDNLKMFLPQSQPDLCDEVSQTTYPDVENIEAYANKTVCSFTVDFYSMQYSLFINNIVEILGSFLFLITAIYVVKDMKKCNKYIAGKLSIAFITETRYWFKSFRFRYEWIFHFIWRWWTSQTETSNQ